MHFYTKNERIKRRERENMFEKIQKKKVLQYRDLLTWMIPVNCVFKKKSEGKKIEKEKERMNKYR